MISLILNLDVLTSFLTKLSTTFNILLPLSLKIAAMNHVSPGVATRYLNLFAHFMQWNNVSTLPKHIGIDEFKGNCEGSKYLFHIYDLDSGNTIHILKIRRYYDIVDFFDSISNRYEVELITMYLYDSFRNAVKTKLKNAIIVADRFHYTRIISNALDALRLKIWRNTKGHEKNILKISKENSLLTSNLFLKKSFFISKNSLTMLLNFLLNLNMAINFINLFLELKMLLPTRKSVLFLKIGFPTLNLLLFQNFILPLKLYLNGTKKFLILSLLLILTVLLRVKTTKSKSLKEFLMVLEILLILLTELKF